MIQVCCLYFASVIHFSLVFFLAKVMMCRFVFFFGFIQIDQTRTLNVLAEVANINDSADNATQDG
jgi:hypothetical protein